MAIIPCRECAHHVSDQAASCPSCGAPIASNVTTRPRSRHRLAKTLIVLMALWTLGTLLWMIQPGWTRDALISSARLTLQRLDGSVGKFPTTEHPNAIAQKRSLQANTVAARVPTQPAPVQRPVYRATAEELYRDYEANAVATQARIGTSLVRVNGSVAGIDQDARGHPVVKLWTGKDSAAAMTLADNQRTAAAQLYKGEAVDIECDKIGGDRVLQGSDCTVAFVDIRTREVNLALFLTNDSGAAHVYVVGPMSEAVCRAHSEEISSRLRGGHRNAHLVWRSCTDAGRESILPGGCHLNAAAVTLPDVPSARLWHYNCSASSSARTASHKRTTSILRPVVASTAAPDTEAEARPAGDEANAIAVTQTSSPASAVTQTSSPPSTSAGETSVNAPAAKATTHVATNLRFAAVGGGSDVGPATAAAPTPAGEVSVAHAPPPDSVAEQVPPAPQESSRPPLTGSPQPSAGPDDLAQIRAMDPQAANHIAAYCSKVVASSQQEALVADCRRNEIAAWTRLVLQNEFPTLNDATRQKCSEPPFPDTYVAKESCARYELHAN
jgi:hypothetical protein